MNENARSSRYGLTAYQVEEMPSDDEWELEVLQLSSGPLNYKLYVIDLGRVAFEFPRCDAALHVGDVHSAPYYSFGFVTDGESAPKLLGRSIDKDEAIVWQPADPFRYEFVTPKSMRGLIVRVDEKFAELRGWAAKIPRYLKPKPSAFKKLQSLCYAIRDRKIPNTRGVDYVLVEWLEMAFGRQLFVDADARRDPFNAPVLALVDQARTYLSGPDVQEIENIDELAWNMGVSRRTLFRAFRQWPGVSPARYSCALRLGEVRRQLIECGPGEASVTSLAQDHGFTHAGRFAAEYRNFFGEKPSETLRRHN